MWPLSSFQTQAIDRGIFRDRERGRLRASLQYRPSSACRNNSPRSIQAGAALLASSLGLDSVLGRCRIAQVMPPRNKIFVSYSHKDRRMFEEFSTMLAPALQNGRIDLWSDQAIPPVGNGLKQFERRLHRLVLPYCS